MSNGTTPPKRTLLSLRSMGVMCGVLALLVSANLMNLTPESRVGRRGLPLTFEIWTESRIVPADEVFRYLGELEEEGWLEEETDFRFEDAEIEVIDLRDARGQVTFVEDMVFDFARQLDGVNLLVDTAVALCVTVLLGLASERFVFRRMRGGPHPEPTENPK